MQVTISETATFPNVITTTEYKDIKNLVFENNGYCNCLNGFDENGLLFAIMMDCVVNFQIKE